MALERNFELIDDYLAGRLNEAERRAFEDNLNNDPQLKGEFQLQQQLVNGVKNARIAELKAMMNNVPVPSMHGTETTAFASKIALWTVVAGIVATGIYFLVQKDEPVDTTKKETQQQQQPAEQPEAQQSETTVIPENDTNSEDEEAPVVSDEKPSSEDKPVKSPSTPKTKKADSVKEPAINVYDPTKETEEELSIQLEESKAPSLSKTPSIAVEVAEDKKYDFHYQFAGDKLVLYGPFEKNLYEVMEFISDDKRTVFLYYQDKFYFLKDDTEKLKPLGAIQDPALIKKLKDYRRN